MGNHKTTKFYFFRSRSEMEPRRMQLNSLDTWRGLVIFLVMLDHVRDFFNRGALTSTPTEAGHTTVLLYLTRWITHLCAPTFLFLAGVGIRLQYEKAGPSRGLSQFLARRGAWLMFLDFTVVSMALNFWAPVLLRAGALCDGPQHDSDGCAGLDWAAQK